MSHSQLWQQRLRHYCQILCCIWYQNVSKLHVVVCDMVDYIAKRCSWSGYVTCRLSGYLLASMMGLDNLLLRRLYMRMFSQSLFTFLKWRLMDGTVH